MINREKAIELFEENTSGKCREIIGLIGWDGVELYIWDDGTYGTRMIGSFSEHESEMAATLDLSPHCFRDLYSEYDYWDEEEDKPKNDLPDEDIYCLYDWIIEDLMYWARAADKEDVRFQKELECFHDESLYDEEF